MDSIKNSLLNKSFSERITTEKQSQVAIQRSSDILNLANETPLLNTLMKNNSQMNRFSMSNISQENQSNLLMNINNLMNYNDTGNSLKSNNLDGIDISKILLQQSNHNGNESQMNSLEDST